MTIRELMSDHIIYKDIYGQSTILLMKNSNLKFKKHDKVIVNANQRVAEVLEYIQNVWGDYNSEWGDGENWMGGCKTLAVIRYTDDPDPYNIAFVSDKNLKKYE